MSAHSMKMMVGARAAVLAAAAIFLLGLALARPALAAAPNACGCYRDGSGSCFCNKKAKCGCPGDCEPKGCDEKRAKQIEKEIQEETRKAQAANRAGGKGKHVVDDDSKESSKKSDKSDKSDKGNDHPAATSPERKAKVVHLTGPERATLRRLLDIYIGEHPDQQSRPVGEVRSSLH